MTATSMPYTIDREKYWAAVQFDSSPSEILVCRDVEKFYLGSSPSQPAGSVAPLVIPLPGESAELSNVQFYVGQKGSGVLYPCFHNLCVVSTALTQSRCFVVVSRFCFASLFRLSQARKELYNQDRWQRISAGNNLFHHLGRKRARVWPAVCENFFSCVLLSVAICEGETPFCKR